MMLNQKSEQLRQHDSSHIPEFQYPENSENPQRSYIACRKPRSWF
jgi:hypothetical protein